MSHPGVEELFQSLTLSLNQLLVVPLSVPLLLETGSIQLIDSSIVVEEISLFFMFLFGNNLVFFLFVALRQKSRFLVVGDYLIGDAAETETRLSEAFAFA